MTHGETIIRAFEAADYAAWRALWLQSVEGEDLALEEDAIDATWQQIMAYSESDSAGMSGLACCLPSGELVGLLHFVLHPVSGCVNPVCYLQDMYVHENFRRRGLGNTLLFALKEKAHALDWERIYWLVKKEDEAAEKFYEGQGIEVPFSVHMHPTRLLKEMNNND